MIILRNATVVDCVGTKPLQNSSVIVDGERIKAIGHDALTPDGADIIIDLKGKTVIPGLIDAHVHLGGTDGFVHPGIGSRVETDDFLKNRTDALRWGVTTVRSAGDYTPDIFTFRDEVNLGRHISPRIVAAGKMIQAKGGHPVFTVFGGNLAIAENACVIFDDNTDLKKEIKALAEAGADWIKAVISDVDKMDYPKPVPRIPPEMISRIIELAHDCGIPCMVHVDNASQLSEAARSGADCIEHVLAVGATDTEIDDSIIDLLVKKQIFVVPTIFSIKKHENPDSGKPLVFEKLVKQMNKLISAGVNIGVGTDSSIPFVPIGESIHDELSLLVLCGMTPFDALKAATVGNAKLLGKDDEIGAVLPGYFADLVVIDGDPSKDISHTKKIDLVISNGRIVNDCII